MEQNGKAIIVREESAMVDIAPVSPELLQAQVNAIQKAMKQVMKVGTHYGTVPGCGDQPTLLKPGAEKIGLMFRLIPALEIQREDLPGGHRNFTVITTLKTIGGSIMGQGVGSCSTMETKYRYRKAERACPKCGKETIIKGKDEYGGGWLCFAKKGGCGAKFKDGDNAIEGQAVGQKENPDIADTYNTVLKMAKKRSLVDATLTATAASDIFTQDIEDMYEYPVQAVAATVEDDIPAEWSEPRAESPKMFYIYDLSLLPKDRHAEAVTILKKVKAVTEDDLMLRWESPVPVRKLVNYQIEGA